MKVYVNYNNKKWHKYKVAFDKIANAAAIDVVPNAEVSIILTDDTEIHKLNREYRNMDKPTNVLSFELGDDILLGDIYISLDTVQREARASGISIAEHTAHMVVHGMLHLQGYDHILDDEAAVMENKEIKILEKLGFKNPYAIDSDACDVDSCPGGNLFKFIKSFKIPSNGLINYISYFLCGAISALGFAPFNMWFMTLFGVGIVYYLTRRDSGENTFWQMYKRVAIFGAAYAMAMFWWALHSIYVVPELTAQFAIWTVPGIIGIGIVGGLIFPWPFIVAARIRTNSAVRAILFAATTAIILWVREWLLTGFPWNPLSNIFMLNLILANSMSLFGALGLSFCISGCISAIIELKFCRNIRNFIVLGFFMLLLFIGVGYGWHNVQQSNMNQNKESPVVRIVQPARMQSEKMSYTHESAVEHVESNMRDLFNLGKFSGNPDLIIYPETTYPFILTGQDEMPLAKALHNNVIIGATTYDSGKIYNSMIVSGDDGIINKIYSKSHLVPFGEYSPFGVMPSPVNLTSGNGAEVISISVNGKNWKFVPAICYEIIFTDSLIPYGTADVDAIVNITNDTWFGKTPGVYQHLAMVQRYAIESGLPIIRANYSGVSALILSNGEILSALPVAERGVIDGIVWGAHVTPYRYLGRDIVMILILLVSCGLCFVLQLNKRVGK